MKIKKIVQKNKFAMLLLTGVLATAFVIAPLASADTYQQQIEQLQAANAQNNASVQALMSQAGSFQDAIRALSANIALLQAQINANVAQQNKLKDQITEAEKQLQIQRDLLGQNIKAMYLEGDISTFEMLASSKDLSHFVDKQQYRSSVKDKIKSTVDSITALELQLKAQKNAVDDLLKQQSSQQAQLNESMAQQQSMLNYNQAQQADFNSKIAQNNSRINQLNALIAAQKAANLRTDGGYYFLRFNGVASGVNPAGYPYSNYGFSMSTLPGCGNPDPNTGQRDSQDRWGFCTRQCVSFAAWAVEASGRTAPTTVEGYGSAASWVQAAYDHPGEVSVSRMPQPGDVAISTRGTWGHAMYVVSVNPDNRSFSTYEYNTYLDGNFHTMTRFY